MSYEIISSDGKGGQLASSQGLAELQAKAGQWLKEFLDSGEADTELAQKVIEEVKATESTAYIGDLFNGKAPFILSNGIADESHEELKFNPHHDSQGRFTETDGGSSTSTDEVLKPPFTKSPYKEIIAGLHEVAPQASVVLYGMTTKNAQLLVDRVKAFGKEFPGALAMVKSFVVSPNLQDKAYAQVDSKYMPGDDERSLSVVFNANWWSDPETLQAAHDKDAASKYHPSGTIQSTIDHELGHVLDNWLREQGFVSSIEFGWNTAMRQDISGYAAKSKSDKETFAEVFSMRQAGLPITNAGIERDFNVIMKQQKPQYKQQEKSEDETTCKDFIQESTVKKYFKKLDEPISSD